MLMNSTDQLAQSHQIRVLISSTFRDKGTERDYLVKFIFSQLKKLCESAQRHPGVGWTCGGG